jgi:hypothetical protein
MKTFAHFRRHLDSSFHMHPLNARFSLIASSPIGALPRQLLRFVTQITFECDSTSGKATTTAGSIKHILGASPDAIQLSDSSLGGNSDALQRSISLSVQLPILPRPTTAAITR